MAKRKEIIERNKEINSMYNAGKTIKQVAAAFNLSITTVQKYIENSRAAGAPTEMTKEHIKAINELYNKGAIMQELAIKFNVSASTISRYVWKSRGKGARRINNEICA